MSEHKLEKLLGGFAADTLTAEERQLLYSAALQDQQLFNALADEQTLKELLADPTVRRKLLQSLKQPIPSAAGEAFSWFDWFKRPAGLAFAGGLVAAVFAVVLGTKIYQDSLKQSANSVVTEKEKPIAPPSQPADDKIELKAKKDAQPEHTAKRERAATLPPLQERQASGLARYQVTQRSKQQEAPNSSEAPTVSPGKATEEVPASADQKLSRQSSAPAAQSPEPAKMEAPAGIAPPAAGASTTSARALFYAGQAARLDQRAGTSEKNQNLKAFSESAPQANRPERKRDRFAAMGKIAQFMPLGLRYSFVIRGTDGQDREVETAIASKGTESTRLTVETNQDAYLQIFETVGSAPAQVFYPHSGGESSLRITAGTRHEIPLPALTEGETTTLTIRLSRKSVQEARTEEADSAGRFSSNQLVESITPGGPTGVQEQATYVVTTDPSLDAQIIADILFGR